jgi:hypothetical protein
MKKIIELLFSDTLYMVLLVLCGAYLVSQERYTLAYMIMASFVVVAVRKAVKSKSE